MAENDPNKEGRKCVVIKGVLVYKRDWVDVSWKARGDRKTSSDTGRITEVGVTPSGVPIITIRNLDGEEKVLIESIVIKIKVRKKPSKKK